MPIRPIDIVRSHEASQYKQVQNQKVLHEQVQIEKLSKYDTRKGLKACGNY